MTFEGLSAIHRTTWSSFLTMWSSRPWLPAPLAGSLSSSSRPATRGCSSGCRSVYWITNLGHSHILLRRSQRLTRMRSCARRYALHRWGEFLRLVNMLQVNENLNNPPAPGSARAGGGSGAGLPGGLPAGISLAFFWPVCLFNFPFFSHLHNSFAYSWPPPVLQFGVLARSFPWSPILQIIKFYIPLICLTFPHGLPT